jgi:DNA-binding Xre family transcriptional regulator
VVCPVSATFIEDAYRRAVTDTLAELAGQEGTGMRIRWRLRMAAARREVWTGVQLRRLLAEKAGLELSAASVSALFTKDPSQIKLSTLIALCTALQCTPDDLFEVDTTPVERPAVPARAVVDEPNAVNAPGRSMPPP